MTEAPPPAMTNEMQGLLGSVRNSYDEFQNKASASRALVPMDDGNVLDFGKMSGDLEVPLNNLEAIRNAARVEFEQTRTMLQDGEVRDAGVVAMRCMDFSRKVGESSLEVDKLAKTIEDVVSRHKVTPERKLAMNIRYVDNLIFNASDVSLMYVFIINYFAGGKGSS